MAVYALSDYARLAFIYVMFIFRIGEKADCSGFSVLDAGEIGDRDLRIPLYRSLQYLRKFLCFKFHDM